MRRIVITGASGQVGRRLARSLAGNGMAVTAIGSDVERLADMLGDGALPAQCLAANDLAGLDEALRGADVLFHCAFARGHEGHALARSLDYASMVFSAARAAGIGAIVNVSSQSVYGSVRAADSTEADPVNPGDRYAVAKYASECLLAGIAAGSATRHTQVRLASLIGEGMEERLVTRFVAQAMAGLPLRIQGGAQQFAFLDMDDAVAGLACMAAVPAAQWKAVYNLAPFAGASLREIAGAVAAAVAQATGRQVPVKVDGEGSPLDSRLDGSLFMRDFGFRPGRDLGASIDAIIARRDWTDAGPGQP